MLVGYIEDTIAAIATPPGAGGIGVIRVSGPDALIIAENITGKRPKVREATLAQYKDGSGLIIDRGLVLYFRSPHSYTGEEVIEFHAHGGIVVLDMLLRLVLSHGARQANAGEFTERAYLNSKIDLAQAEAVSDLINSATEVSALAACRSLSGEFSQLVTDLERKLISLRVYVEAAIDFPEEEVDFLDDPTVKRRLQSLQEDFAGLLRSVQQGVIIKEGYQVAFTGKPNAGKSSLLNALTQQDVAIVTAVPGTTRDVVSATIDIGGLAVRLFDTAGIREVQDEVEQIGVERAKKIAKEADLVLHLIDATQGNKAEFGDEHTIVVFNKIDLEAANVPKDSIAVSAKTRKGLQQLKSLIRQHAGYKSEGDGMFSARRRHLQALNQANTALQRGIRQLKDQRAGELLAEELIVAQTHLGKITGDYSPDDLLGEIFSSFCIGK